MAYLLSQLHVVISSRVDPSLPLSRLRARHQLVELRADDLRFTFAEAAATSQEVIRKPGGRASIHSSRASGRLGQISRELNELDQATRYVQQSILLREQAGLDLYLSQNYLASAQVYWTRGEVGEALAALDKAEQIAVQLENARAVRQARAVRARVELAQGHLAQASRWSAEAGVEVHDEPAYERENDYLMLARLRLAQHRAEEAVGLLERLLTPDEAAGRTGNTIAVLALQALANVQQGNAEQAMRVLSRLLALAEPEGYVRVVVDEGPPMQVLLAAWLASSGPEHDVRGMSARAAYVEMLLAAFPSTDAQHDRDSKDIGHTETVASRSPLIEPLTAREQDVLELLAEGLSNAEIAARLVVTVGTAKTYIKGIYGKLAVHSRTQAILRARDSGLL